jgi:hypothetical protein
MNSDNLRAGPMWNLGGIAAIDPARISFWSTYGT